MEKEIKLIDVERELIVRFQSNEDDQIWLDFFTKEGLKTIYFSSLDSFNELIKRLNETSEVQER